MTDLPASTAPAAAGYPLVQGHCPACRGSSLFLGSGGYLTCSRLDCPNPSAADDVLHRTAPTGQLREHLAAAVDKAIDDDNLDNLTDFSERLVAAVLTAVEDFLDIGDAEAWCKICRRVWDSKRHRCESDAEQRLSQTRDAGLQLLADADAFAARHNRDCECDWVPATREAANRILAAIDQTKERAATGATIDRDARGYCPHCGRGDCAPTADEYEQQRQRAQQLAATLDDVLRHFVHKGHPGEPCLSSGWISEKTVARWRDVAHPPQPAAHDNGPTVAECAHNDRRWPLEKEGE